MIRKICLADWDGTLRRGYTNLDWLKYLNQQGLIPETHILAFQESLGLHQKGILDYKSLVIEAANIYASAIQGQNTNEIATKAADFVSQDRHH